jgi:hypothetical protein
MVMPLLSIKERPDPLAIPEGNRNKDSHFHFVYSSFNFLERRTALWNQI